MRFCMCLIIFATEALASLSSLEAVQLTPKGLDPFFGFRSSPGVTSVGRKMRQTPQDFVYVCQDAGAGGYEAFPDVCRLNNGQLMCVFYAGYGHVALPNEQLPNGGRIVYCTSSDEGQTWSHAETLFDGPDDDRDPSIVQLSDGRLICNFFSLRKTDTPMGYEGLGSWIVTSDDLGKSWSMPRQISKSHYCSAPIRKLSNGRLILGMYTENGDQSQGSVIFSDDGGTTWQPEVLIDNGGIRLDAETDMIELRDGTLYAAQRPHMSIATSQDFGTTWTVSEPIGFPGHCPYFLRTPDDVIILAFRLPITSLRFSRDECKTWSDNVVIDEVTGAYPSMVNLMDGSVLVVYYEEGKGSSIRARKFRITDKGISWIPIASD
jgi:sialidase-1